MLDPATGKLAAFRIGADHGTQGALLDHERFAFRTCPADALFYAAERLRALRRALPGRAPVRGLQDDHVGGVDIAVGEAPGDPVFAAGDDVRGAQQGDSGDVERRAADPASITSRARHQVFGSRRPMMHVIGDDGCAMRNDRPAHGELVAARNGWLDRRRAGRRVLRTKRMEGSMPPKYIGVGRSPYSEARQPVRNADRGITGELAETDRQFARLRSYKIDRQDNGYRPSEALIDAEERIRRF